MSIIIPCYNHAHFLRQSITSALAQTYRPTQVVVVDDGSTDDSSAIAAQFPVTLIRQPNRGVAAALNVGVRASGGLFALTLGADDLLHPEYVEQAMQAMMSSPDASFAYSRIIFFGTVDREYPTQEFDVESLAERNYISSAAMFRRSAFDLVRGFDSSMPRCEDWDFWLSLAERGHLGIYIPRPLVFGRQRAGSYNSRHYFSPHGLRREISMAVRLRRKHPGLFAPPALTRRLQRLPARLARGEVSPRFAGLLVALYGCMLLDAAAHRSSE